MRGAVAHRPGFRSLTGALYRSQCDAHLGFTGRRSQFLDRLALAVAAQEIHRTVHAGGIALKHLLDETDRFEVVAPVERRTQAQAGQDIGHGYLSRRLTLVLIPDRIFGRHLLGVHVLLDDGVERRQAQAILAHSLQQADDVRDVGGRGQGRGRQTRFTSGNDGIGRDPRCSGNEDLFRQPPEVLDQRQFQDARPGPELTDGERRDRLVAVHESDELRPVQPAVAVPDELERHRIDPGVPGPLPLRKPR